MLVLALDTALAATSVAVLDTAEDAVVAAATAPMERGHAEALMPMVADAVAAAGGLPSIDRLAVTTGPGSFTGIRVALAAARALRLATGKPLVGLTTLTVLAAPFLALDDGRAVAAAIDARHERVFFQMFGRGARSMVPARLIPVREAARATGGSRVRIVGSGAAAVAAAAERPELAEPTGLVPDPVWLARLAAVSEVPERPPRPLYLRGADARPQAAAQVARR